MISCIPVVISCNVSSFISDFILESSCLLGDSSQMFVYFINLKKKLGFSFNDFFFSIGILVSISFISALIFDILFLYH